MSGQSRREFLRRIGRYAAGGALVAGMGVLVGRRGTEEAAQECAGRVPCEKCSLLARCELPEAVAVRKA